MPLWCFHLICVVQKDRSFDVLDQCHSLTDLGGMLDAFCLCLFRSLDCWPGVLFEWRPCLSSALIRSSSDVVHASEVLNTWSLLGVVSLSCPNLILSLGRMEDSTFSSIITLSLALMCLSGKCPYLLNTYWCVTFVCMCICVISPSNV